MGFKKLPFEVTSAEVAINCLDHLNHKSSHVLCLRVAGVIIDVAHVAPHAIDWTHRQDHIQVMIVDVQNDFLQPTNSTVVENSTSG